VQLPFTTLRFDFNEEVTAASVGVNDLVLSQGRVTGASRVDADTVEYTLADISREGAFTVVLPAGVLADVFGNPNLSYTGTYDLDVGTVPFPTPLEAKAPLGSLVYDPLAEGVIGVADDTDSWTIALDAGQTITVVVQPDAALAPQVEVRDPGGTSLGTAGGAAGADAVLQTAPVASAGTYTITVGSVGQSSAARTVCG